MRIFVVAKEFFLLLQRSLTVAKKYFKRKKKAPTFLREAGAHGRRSQGLSRRFFSNFFLIFVIPTKITTFFKKVFIEHTYKVYGGNDHKP